MNSINRYEQLLRMCYLIEILSNARRPLSTSELKEGLVDRGAGDGLCDRTVRRDLGFLESFGYPLKRDSSSCGGRGKGGRWSLEGRTAQGGLTPPPMSLPEVLALLVARDYLSPLAGTLYWKGLTELLARAERQASPALIEFAKEHRDGVVVHPTPEKGRYRARLLAAVNRSIRNKLELEILYQAFATRRPCAVGPSQNRWWSTTRPFTSPPIPQGAMARLRLAFGSSSWIVSSPHGSRPRPSSGGRWVWPSFWPTASPSFTPRPRSPGSIALSWLQSDPSGPAKSRFTLDSESLTDRTAAFSWRSIEPGTGRCCRSSWGSPSTWRSWSPRTSVMRLLKRRGKSLLSINELVIEGPRLAPTSTQAERQSQSLVNVPSTNRKTNTSSPEWSSKSCRIDEGRTL